MKRTSHRLLALLLGASTALAVGTYASAQTFVPVTDAALSNPDPNDWLMVSRTYDEHRFSPLNQIDKSNVKQLRMAWARSLPLGTQESTPIVYRGVMYLFAPGATIQAVDATNGDLIWEYARKYPVGVMG
jgi:alcohol dehydrogenase (cytochrome c)